MDRAEPGRPLRCEADFAGGERSGLRLLIGHRRRFSEADKRRILEEVAHGGTSVAELVRRYGIDRRVPRRWKQELAAAPA
jgi:transposase-like protein